MLTPSPNGARWPEPQPLANPGRFNQTPVPVQPTETAFHDPPPGKHDEPADVVGAFDDGDGQGQHGRGPGDQPPGVAAVGPHEGDRGEPFPQQRQ
jgi:hypothetical protein